MIKAFFVDFYGTVVHEDGVVIKDITRIIESTGKAQDPSEIDAFWWRDFQSLFQNAHGETFETQRALETKSIAHTLEKFHSTADAEELSAMLFANWVNPPIFPDSLEFFSKSTLPVYIVSNIDTADIQEAIRYHDLTPAGVFTSEDAKAYKPRKELFELALKETGYLPEEVVHIGDSISSDVKGASALGIRTLWLNRSGKAVPEGVESIGKLPEALERII